MQEIDFINSSTVIKDEDALRCMKALQIQLDRDYFPVWGSTAHLNFVKKGDKGNPEHWCLIVLDTSDDASAEGWHDLTPNGQPMGKIFAKSTIADGDPWTTTASHETLELLGNPWLNKCVEWDRPNGTVFVSYEVCDSPEDTQFGYKIRIDDGSEITVSDFVYPTWFEDCPHPAGTKFDYMGKITTPFQLLEGGYTSIFDPGNNKGWSQINARENPHSINKYSDRARVGSRRERLRVGKAAWLRSDPKDIGPE